MAVFTPRLVLVCAVPAVVTLLTIFWTRQRRKSLTVKKKAEKKLPLPNPETQVQKSDDLFVVPVARETVLEKESICSNNFERNQAAAEAESTLTLYDRVDSAEDVPEKVSETTVDKSEFSGSRSLVQEAQVDQILLNTLQHSLKIDNQICNGELERNSVTEEVQTILPKMHVKSSDNQLSVTLEQEGHLSPQGGSTSDLSDRQNSPINSEASFSDVHDESKPFRKRGSCRLSEESRDSAMGGDEELSLTDGPPCALLESTPSASFTEVRTEFQKDLLLPEVQQPTMNGESGCYNDLDEVLESPPPSVYSDGHSEGSCDSGKGGSDIQVLTGSDLAQLSENALLVYEFELAQEWCGRLIGRQGKHVNFIKSSSNANVFIKRHPFNARLKLCAVQGTKSEIKNALDLIRKRFPVAQYPSLSLVQVNIPLTCGVMVPETLQLHLPEGVTCDVILSSMVSAGHFFVQQPTHPTYPSLNRLDTCMTSCYSQMDTPQLPQPVEVGVICACPVLEGWFRAQVVSLYENSEECDVKFVDYGGYSCVPMSRLRQIRSDFMTLPFQASECYLANVKPTTETWSLEACATFEELAQGQILQSLVVGHAEDGIPYVHLYRVQGVSTVFINRELVNRGVAQWLEAEM